MLTHLRQRLAELLAETETVTLANRIGLGMPLIEGWTKREPV
ncbi:MAG TPA: hypothetical protein VK879_06605 [Candidatus Sulfomarinibacteraceae bacterium]|nr:hypothetical protein [Candidatus Sulfomarinibacteraceae bacterium]